jgi:P27 family predicted phage terminase small subunit
VRGRKPVPTNLRVIRGNPQKRPIRPEPLPQLPAELEPPEFLLEEAKAEWHRVGPELVRLNLLTVLDLAAFAAYCQSWARWLLAEQALAAAGGALTIKTPRGSEVMNPLLHVARDAAAAMLRYAVEFGMTPSSRGRLGSVGEPPGGGKFDGLLSS